MRAAGIFIVAAAAAIVTSCSWGTYDDLKSSAWVQFVERDDTQTNGDFGLDLMAAPPESGKNGIRYIISVGNPPAGLAQATFNGSGSLTNQIGYNAESGGKGALEPMDDKSPAYSLQPYVGETFLAGVQGGSDVLKYELGLKNGSAVLNNGPAGSGRTVATGNLGYGSANPDVVVLGTLSLTIIPNGDKTPISCNMKAPNPANSPVVAEEALRVTRLLNPGLDHDLIVVGHINLANEPKILILDTKDPALRNGDDCPETTTLPSVDGGPVSIAIGNLDSDPKPEIVAGSLHSANGRVFVYRNYTPGQTPAMEEIPSPDEENASGVRGSRMRIADVEGDSGNELIVADSGATSKGASIAGQVQIYRSGACTSGGTARGTFCLLHTLFDPSPARNDQFGRGLAIGSFKSSKGERTILAVAQKNRIWVYFKLTKDQTDPRD